MSATTRTIAITGASGLVGRAAAERFLRDGWRVRALVRRLDATRIDLPGIEYVSIDLPNRFDANVLAGADVLLHAAYATRERDPDAARRVNEDGTALVVAAARAASARVVFISSLSAHADAVSYYGRSKAACEQRLDVTRDLIVRPGLVLAAQGGLASRIWSAVERLPLLPLVGGDSVLQTVHLDDLVSALARAVESGMTGRLTVAEPSGISLRDLVQRMARSSGRRPWILPVPTWLARFGLRTAEALQIALPVTAENLDGLLASRREAPSPELQALGIQLRSAAESVAALADARRAA